MTTIREGAIVSYIGYSQHGLSIGDEGKVLSNAGSASHVRWLTGTAQDQVTLVMNEDLVPSPQHAGVEDELASSLLTFSVRDIYDEQGELGVLSALSSEGHLTSFAQIADEALGWVQDRVGSDPSVREALAHLEPHEQIDTLMYMSMALLRDAFGREDG